MPRPEVWTQTELENLLHYVFEFHNKAPMGSMWKWVGEKVGRSANACHQEYSKIKRNNDTRLSNQYGEQLEKISEIYTPVRRHKWTTTEDEKLVEILKKMGSERKSASDWNDVRYQVGLTDDVTSQAILDHYHRLVAGRPSQDPKTQATRSSHPKRSRNKPYERPGGPKATVSSKRNYRRTESEDSYQPGSLELYKDDWVTLEPIAAHPKVVQGAKNRPDDDQWPDRPRQYQYGLQPASHRAENRPLSPPAAASSILAHYSDGIPKSVAHHHVVPPQHPPSSSPHQSVNPYVVEHHRYINPYMVEHRSHAATTSSRTVLPTLEDYGSRNVLALAKYQDRSRRESSRLRSDLSLSQRWDAEVSSDTDSDYERE